jgi:Phage protein (N4 Gp49/phage Sf6 gene 66) family
MILERPEFTPFEKDLYIEWTRDAQHTTLHFEAFNNKTTVCVLKLANGFEIVGTSGCEDPHKFDALLGRVYAMKDALRELNEFTAFYRAQKAFEVKNAKPIVSRELSPFEVEELRRLIAKEQAKPMHGQAITTPVDAYTTVTSGSGYMTTNNKLEGITDSKLDVKA